MIDIKKTVEYRLISRHYGDRVAQRSQVPLINHINEGLIVLDNIDATDAAKKAFCIHPMLQHDDDLAENYYICSFVEPQVLLLAMEYRSVANEFLSDKMDLETVPAIRLSPLQEVSQMLVADKVQNYKDFTKYHYGTHPRSEKLNEYFHKWFEVLEVNLTMYKRLYKLIDLSKNG
jgi:hypothetical protein